MAVKNNASPREGLTFDDVLIKPGLSEVLPADVDIRSRVTRSITVNIPIIASAMDTVTEAQMAIAMAQAGGIGVLHRNMEPDEQAAQVRQVKKFESGMVVNPLTIEPDATLQQALDLMKDNRISGIPVVERAGNAQPGKLVGILTNRDVRFATDPRQKISELMTEKLITVREGVSQDEAKRLLHQHRIEKLLVVDAQYRCVGLITVKDIEKAVANPNACKDEQGRLRVAAATTVGDKGFARTEALIAAGVRPCRGRHGARSLEVRARCSHAHKAAVKQSSGRCRQYRDRGGRQSADRLWCGRHQSRHRSWLDLHDADCGRGRRAAVDSRSWNAPEAAKATGMPIIADGGIK